MKVESYLLLLLPLCACGRETPATDEGLPPRYDVEFLYVIHRNLTAESSERLESLLRRAYPDFDDRQLEPTDEERDIHSRLYANRLHLEAKTRDDTADTSELVQQRVRWELGAHAVLKHLLAEARKEESLKAVFNRLVAEDDSKRPVCTSEPGKGLLVYRHVTGASWEELRDLEDSGVQLGVDFSVRVDRVSRGGLPAFSEIPDVLGVGHGIHVFRVLRVDRGSKALEK